MWTVKTKKEGSHVLLTEYQTNTIRKLLSEKEPILSASMWKHLIEIMGDNHPSRASVINFLNELVEYGYADFNDGTGKGGHHRLYYTKLTKEEFSMKISKDIGRKLNDAINLILNF